MDQWGSNAGWETCKTSAMMMLMVRNPPVVQYAGQCRHQERRSPRPGSEVCFLCSTCNKCGCDYEYRDSDDKNADKIAKYDHQQWPQYGPCEANKLSLARAQIASGLLQFGGKHHVQTLVHIFRCGSISRTYPGERSLVRLFVRRSLILSFLASQHSRV